MKVEFLPNGNINYTITDFEKFELNRIKLDFENQLNTYAENERSDLDITLSTHLLNTQKLAELHNLRSYIISDLDYNSDYKNIISLNNGIVEFKNAELFFLFASSYQILDDTTRAVRILENITRIKVIERMIEVDYPGNDMKVTFIYETPLENKTNTFNSKIFGTAKSELFFNYVLNDWIKEKNEPLVYISFLFRQFWEKEKEKTDTILNNDYTIHCKIDEFITYCNTLGLKKQITKMKLYYEIGHITNKQSKLRTYLEIFENNGCKIE